MRVAAVPRLPHGAFVHSLEPHLDERGSFTELFRAEWPTGVAPIQWNAVRSGEGNSPGSSRAARGRPVFVSSRWTSVSGLAFSAR